MSSNAAFADHVPVQHESTTPYGDTVRHGNAVQFGTTQLGTTQVGTTALRESAEAAELERWYAQRRRWPIVRDAQGTLWLSVGADFDVVEVPEEAGRGALHRLIGYGQAALAPGPVALTGTDRCGFFVAPGARDDLPELLDWLDWGGIDLGLTAYGAGDQIAAPARGRWLHDPLAVPPEVIALLATIAESCSRYALNH